MRAGLRTILMTSGYFHGIFTHFHSILFVLSSLLFYSQASCVRSTLIRLSYGGKWDFSIKDMVESFEKWESEIPKTIEPPKSTEKATTSEMPKGQ